MRSSFLSRASMTRNERPKPPSHDSKGVSIHLSDLPRPPERAPLHSPSELSRSQAAPEHRNSSSSLAYSDQASSHGSSSKLKPRALFAGPPPPIASSKLLHRDEEEDLGLSTAYRGGRASNLARSALSVFSDGISTPRASDSTLHTRPDAIWRNLQRREMAIQKELQYLLDVQSEGLATNLEPADLPTTHAAASHEAAHGTTSTLAANRVTGPFWPTESDNSTHWIGASEVMPVRQPRQQPIGLHGARLGLSRNMVLLANLKAEEDANLVTALDVRKTALARLRKLSIQREGILEELDGLESNTEDSLAKELRELEEEHTTVSSEITRLEETLIGLRNRKKWLGRQVEDVRNRRDAGLSGYRGALEEVENRVAVMLRRPPIVPLDFEALGVTELAHSSALGEGFTSRDSTLASLGGMEFMRMRPERRTPEMAKDWWENEIDILEQRKLAVNKEREALKRGLDVWKQCTDLVLSFENSLRSEMNGSIAEASPAAADQAMKAQLANMDEVMASLEQHLQLAELEGWNLLTCGIGAELEAFRQARAMLQEALQVGGDISGDEKPQPSSSSLDQDGPDLLHVASLERRSSDALLKKDDANPTLDSVRNSLTLPARLARRNSPPTNNSLKGESEPQQYDSENEIPPEFLAEHAQDEYE